MLCFTFSSTTIFIVWYTYIPLYRVRQGRHAWYSNVYYSKTGCRRERRTVCVILFGYYSDIPVAITVWDLEHHNAQTQK